MSDTRKQISAIALGAYHDGWRDALARFDKADEIDSIDIDHRYDRSMAPYHIDRLDLSPTTAEVVAYLRTRTDEELRAILVEYGGAS